jgi:hypothetical protein
MENKMVEVYCPVFARQRDSNEWIPDFVYLLDSLPGLTTFIHFTQLEHLNLSS